MLSAAAIILPLFFHYLPCSVHSAPLRDAKALAYYDYLQPLEYAGYEDASADFFGANDDQNDLSRTIPGRKQSISSSSAFNSPIYYIRLPPQPYMFVPGLGYISQPPPPPPNAAMSQLVNLPVSFVTNGKPSTIYQWSAGGYPGNTEVAPPRPVKKPDSAVHKLQGQYNFNGKPEDIFVLRDSYNSLYGDALQNFYP